MVRQTPICCCLYLNLIFSLGLLVSIVILQQGIGLLAGAWGDLTDAGVSSRTRQSLERALKPLISSSSPTEIHTPAILGIHELRARRAGSLMFVDLTAEVQGTLTVGQASTLDEKIMRTLKEAKTEITEVRVKFVAKELGNIS